jgi:pimeloyl-ACP methyl ester carboxylesterase
MPTFVSFDGTEIHYTDEGDGPPVVLLHGFASSADTNWRRPGVIDALVGAGYRVIAPDARGHGSSGKPHDTAAYADNAMVHDLTALLDHLALDRVDLVGYSMGGIVGLGAATAEPRVRSLTVAAVGRNAALSQADRAAIAEALEADDESAEMSPRARAFRTFAHATGGDLTALAAIQRASYAHDSRPEEIAVPTVVITGTDDTHAGPPEALAERIPGARAVRVPGDHLNAVTKPEFRAALLAHLAEIA